MHLVLSYLLTRHMEQGEGRVAYPRGEDRFLQASSLQALLPDHTCHPCHPPSWGGKSCFSSLTMTLHGSQGFTQTTHRPLQLCDLGADGGEDRAADRLPSPHPRFLPHVLTISVRNV